MSRSNRKIKTLFAIWTWLKKEATMDAVINDDGPIPTTRWVPLLDEKGEPVMRMSEWSGYEYPEKVLQEVPDHELEAKLNQYIYQLQYIPASERDEWGMSLVKKARKESKSAGKREIAQQLQEMRDDAWQTAEDEGWEALYRDLADHSEKTFLWNAQAKAFARIKREIAKSWEDKRYYDKRYSHLDFWERCDPSAGCSFCGDGECNDDHWPGMHLDYRDFLLHGTTLDWDYDPKYDEVYHDEDHRFKTYGDKTEFYYNAPTLNEMWDEQEEIVRCNRYIDKMDLGIDMMHHEHDLLWAEWEDDDWDDFFPGHKEPLEDTEKRRLIHAERRRRTFTP